MELHGSNYLFTVGVIAATFAGFAGLTVIFRQILGGQPTKLDSFVVRIFVQLGFMTIGGSLLPPLLALFNLPSAVVWCASSSVMAVILGIWALSYPHRRHSISPRRVPFPIWCVIAVLDFAALTLAANAIVPTERAVGIYSAAITVILMGAGSFFLFSLIYLYAQPTKPVSKP
jgi:hypothetical protein